MFTHFFFTRTLLLIAFTFSVLLCSAQVPVAPTPKTKPNTLIFKLKPDYELQSYFLQEVKKLLSPIQPHTLKQKFPRALPQPFLKPGEIDLTLLYELEYNPGVTFNKLKAMLLSTGVVTYVEPVNIPEILKMPNDPLADSLKGNQYYLKTIKAYKGWDIQTGDSSVVIGVLDTGINLNHEDLKKKIKYNYADPINGIDDDNDGYVDNFRGWDLGDNDNDPTADANAHGIFVSGIIAAEANNGKGLAGVAYNCKILPIKVYNSKAKGSFAGYEAIVYAADHGCKVINLSWGSPGFSSAYEQDIINYAVINKKVIVVAAAGNTGGDFDFYPASYDNVISVTSVDPSDNRVFFHTYSNKVDLMAPGLSITTTGAKNNEYTYGHGTSFAAPIVAAAAALVSKQFPHYTAMQVAEQIRLTTDNIYHIQANAPFQERLGRGRLNLYRALSETNTKSVRNIENQFSKGNSLMAGDTLKITGTFQNVLSPTANLQVTLTSTSPYVTILQNNFAAGAVTSGASVTNANNPFVIYINPDIPLNSVLNFRYGFSDGSYTDYQYFKIAANPDFVTININNLGVSITSKGNIGYNGLDYQQGDGVFYKKGNPLLAEGGIMIGTTPGRVSDNIRNHLFESDNNFSKVAGVRFIPNPKFADIAAQGAIQDSFPSTNTAGVRVSYRAYAWKNAPNHKFVVLEYKITNNTLEPFQNLYAGMYTDWDIDGAFRNAADWDPDHQMGYVYNVDRRNVYAGVKLLSDLPATHYAIDNLYGPTENISLSDGFSDVKKYRALSNTPDKNRSAGLNGQGNDVSDVTGARIPTLAPGETVTVAFAILAGDNLEDLQKSATEAKARYIQVKISPTPVLQNDTICPGTPSVISPENGSKFKFYADADRKTMLGSGLNYKTPRLNSNIILYVSNADSLYESPLVPVKIQVQKPNVAFTYNPNPETLALNGLVNFKDQTPDAVSWHWYFGDKGESRSKEPVIQYQQPGNYNVKLVVTDSKGCVDSLTQNIQIKYLDFSNNWQAADFVVYPNPTQDQLFIQIPANIAMSNNVTLEVINLMGAVVKQQAITRTGLHNLKLAGLAKGMYVLQIRGKDGIYRQKFQYL
ncbi:MAG: S8 family serine peptidase [Adhaeribacter sp.]